jgi:hypothetical protein
MVPNQMPSIAAVNRRLHYSSIVARGYEGLAHTYQDGSLTSDSFDPAFNFIYTGTPGPINIRRPYLLVTPLHMRGVG